MAIIDTLRFRNILVDGDIAEEAPAQEFVAALDETFEDVTGDLANKDDLAAMEARLMQDAAEREARTARNQLVMVGIILAGIALAVGIILGVLA
ncbi:MAG: hypothetical protein OXH38_09740 [Chloroflexi bacterium]|nr:hypothetical protein [Chloroflexota bacterium]